MRKVEIACSIASKKVPVPASCSGRLSWRSRRRAVDRATTERSLDLGSALHAVKARPERSRMPQRLRRSGFDARLPRGSLAQSAVTPPLRELLACSASLPTYYGGKRHLRVSRWCFLDEIASARGRGSLHLPMPSDKRLRKIGRPDDQRSGRSANDGRSGADARIARAHTRPDSIARETGMSSQPLAPPARRDARWQRLAGGASIQGRRATALTWKAVSSVRRRCFASRSASPGRRRMAERHLRPSEVTARRRGGSHRAPFAVAAGAGWLGGNLWAGRSGTRTTFKKCHRSLEDRTAAATSIVDSWRQRSCLANTARLLFLSIQRLS